MFLKKHDGSEGAVISDRRPLHYLNSGLCYYLTTIFRDDSVHTHITRGAGIWLPVEKILKILNTKDNQRVMLP